MAIAIVTGSGGLIGSESVAHFVRAGYEVLGLENDMRARFFGESASTAANSARLVREFEGSFRSLEIDIRDRDRVDSLFAEYAKRRRTRDSHGRATVARLGGIRSPYRFHRQRQRNAESPAGLTGSRPGRDVRVLLHEQGLRRPPELPAAAGATRLRLELPVDHRYYKGIDTTMSIDRSTHSLFGVSKASADLLVQEYGQLLRDADRLFSGWLPDRP